MENRTTNIPSVHALTCPKCQHNDLRILGTKGSRARGLTSSLLFGAIGNLVANSNSKDDYSEKPIQYKCNICGNKFESLPLAAEPEEILETPCMISFTRLSSFVGMAVEQHIYLNGVKVDTVGNRKTVTFKTLVKHNTIFVTDQYGIAFKGDYKFVAESGGKVEIRFKRKFL